VFQICVPNQKVPRKKIRITFLKLFLNTMIKNIKIQNIFNMIEISKSMELNKRIQKQFMKMFISVFPMIFQNSMGPRKIKV